MRKDYDEVFLDRFKHVGLEGTEYSVPSFVLDFSEWLVNKTLCQMSIYNGAILEVEDETIIS